MESRHGLNEKQLEIIREILSSYKKYIKRVGLFGSRATGKYRNNSDIDIVLYGDIEKDTLDRIWTLFDESSMPVKTDINAYNLIDNKALKNHIDSVMLPLFEQDEL